MDIYDLTKSKSRIVAREDLQRNGIQETYAATLFAKTFRAMMAIAAYFGLEAYQWDIKKCICECSNGCCRMSRWFQATKQSHAFTKSTLWPTTITETVAKNIHHDTNRTWTTTRNGRFMCFSNKNIVLLVFVDDIIVFVFRPEAQNDLTEFQDNLTKHIH